MNRTLDRLIQFDERSKAYPIRSTLDTTKPRSYTWAVPEILDQGREGACVGFAWAHEAAARPVEVLNVDAGTALSIYRRAQQIDEWEGEDYEGTSVLAGAKAFHEFGYTKEYRWAFGIDDALAGVSRQGPAVIGVWWWSGMFQPDEKGFVTPEGYRAGGHAVVVNGVSVKNKTVTITNSWGPAWGQNGTCKMRWDAFAFLLEDSGECCFPVKRTFPVVS